MAKNKDSSVLWWIGWITLTIVSFFISSWFWTPIIAKKVGTMQTAGAPVIWVIAVFGTWMILLVPLIIFMYSKVDKAYEDARIEREKSQFNQQKKIFGIRCIDIPLNDRKISAELARQLKQIPETMVRGHLVNLVLKTGKKVQNVFILDRKEILGIYEKNSFDFKLEEIQGFEAVSPESIKDFKEEKWLRLDGVGDPV